MSNKEKIAEIIERMPQELVQEVQHYAEYLLDKSRNDDWSRVSLAHLAARYSDDEVEYTPGDLKR